MTESKEEPQEIMGPPEPHVIKSMSPEFLSQLAKDIATNLVFVDRYIREHDVTVLGMVFLPIAMGAFADWSEEETKQIGLIYEYYKEAGPREINGYPIFMSMGVLGVEDAQTVLAKVVKANEALKAI